MVSKQFKIEQEDITIMAQLIYVGEDILVILTGGDTPHIGALALGNRLLGLQTVVLPKHKDFVVVNQMANYIKNVTNRNVCVLGGIHIDNISNVQIQLVTKLCEKLTGQIVDSIS